MDPTGMTVVATITTVPELIGPVLRALVER